MRTGEIKRIIGKVLNGENQIAILSEPIFGGQAYLVKNFAALIESLDLIAGQSWNDLDYAPIEAIKVSHGTSRDAQLEQGEYNALNAYVNSLNAKIPLYVAVLDSLSEHQDEKIINIRLPERVHTFQGLNSLNSRLEKICKLFQVDAPFNFHGFDRGTNWYEIITTGILSHTYLVSCLKVAQEVLKTKTEYYKSEEAELNYRASLRAKEQFDEKGFSAYNESHLKLLIEREVRKVIENVGQTNGRSAEELHTHLVSATKELIRELGEGTEFHLSLNPPSYAEEDGGALSIYYKRLPKPVEPPRQLGTKEDAQEKSA